MKNLYLKKGFAFVIIFLFIGLTFAPSINANISKAFIDEELVEVKICLFNKGCIKEEKTFVSEGETEQLKQLLTNLYNALRKGDKAEIQQCYAEIEKNNILGTEMLETISQYEHSLDEPEWNASLVLGLANSSYRIFGLMLFMAFLNMNNPYWIRVLFLLLVSPVFIFKYIPPFNALSILEIFLIDCGRFHSRSKRGSWDASSGIDEDPFGAFLIYYSGILVTFSTDFKSELFPSEFLFVCGYARVAAYLHPGELFS
ncbi:MAG: hypothetical protein JSW60_03725 [Thermoplasmatales archaeon]|nr:MAG: hypothetical protein JSW60_03725 [Thermoplasmatales archaeon]